MRHLYLSVVLGTRPLDVMELGFEAAGVQPPDADGCYTISSGLSTLFLYINERSGSKIAEHAQRVSATAGITSRFGAHLTALGKQDGSGLHKGDVDRYLPENTTGLTIDPPGVFYIYNFAEIENALKTYVNAPNIANFDLLWDAVGSCTPIDAQGHFV